MFVCAIACGLPALAISQAHAGPSFDAFKRILEERGLKNVSSASVEDVDGGFRVFNLSADQDGKKVSIKEIIATNAKAMEWGFSADRIVISEAKQEGNDMGVAIRQLTLSALELPYSTSQRSVGLSSAIMTDFVAIDAGLNALAFDRFMMTLEPDGKAADVGFKGYVSGTVLSSLVPWALSPVQEDRVPFNGSMKITASDDQRASLSSEIKLSGYGDYEFSFDLSDVKEQKLDDYNAVFHSYKDVKVASVRFSMSNMEWLGKALKKHPTNDVDGLIDFISNISGGLVAQIGTIDDGILLKNSVKAFMEAPSGLTISATPGLKVIDMTGSREPQSLNLKIVESLSAGGRKDQSPDSVVE